ncbi:hypothetical protein HDU92_008452 [Lobulomyces angularis]|nr:hypothetical protein HDU92_008452 [Lobulomyces angularis]
MNVEESLKKRNEALEKAKMEIEKRHKVNYLVNKGFPNLGRNMTTSETPSYYTSLNNNTVNINIIEDNFTILEEYNKQILLEKELQSVIWASTLYGEETLSNWRTEADIRRHVASALQDIISYVKKERTINILLEQDLSSTLKEYRANIAVIRIENNDIIGICEVKKPSIGGNDLDNNKLYTQINNYMQELRYTYGTKYVIAIITTYNEWRICWYSNVNNIAKSRTESEILKHIRYDKDSYPYNIDENTLYLSECYKHNDPSIAQILTSCIHKMYVTHNETPENIKFKEFKFKYIEVNQSKMYWKSLPETLQHFTYQFPRENINGFYLLKKYHDGRDGRAWLSCSDNGNLVVLKLSSINNSTSAEEMLNNESKYWNDIWDCNTYVTKFDKDNTLIMPFAFQCIKNIEGKIYFKSPEVWNKNETKKDILNFDYMLENKLNLFDVDKIKSYIDNPMTVAREALTVMKEKGFRHDDIEWRHVALLPIKVNDNNWTVKPIMIDLTGIKKVDSKDIDINIELSKLKTKYMEDNRCLKRKIDDLTKTTRIKNKEYGINYLVKNGLPKLTVDIESSNESITEIPSRVKPVKLISENFTPLSIYDDENLLKMNKSSVLWATFNIKNEMIIDWNQDNAILKLISVTLYDIKEYMKESHEIIILQETLMPCIEREKDLNIIVIKSINNKIIGVCIPINPNFNENNLDNIKIYNIVNDCMKEIKYSCQSKFIFVIITTYIEWRICWCSNTSIIAGAFGKHLITSSIDTSVNTPLTNLRINTLYVRKIYKFNDPSITKIILSCMYKMYIANKKEFEDTGEKDIKFKMIQPLSTTSIWRSLSTEVKYFNCLPGHNSRRIYLLGIHSRDANNRTWLSCSHKKTLLLMKIRNKNSNLEVTLEEELKLWELLWDIKVNIMSSLDRQILLLPYVVSCRKDCNSKVCFKHPVLWKTEKYEKITDIFDCNKILMNNVTSIFDKDSISKYIDNPLKIATVALNRLKEKGFKHNDIKWEYIALMPFMKDKTWHLEPIITDLINIKQEDPENISIEEEILKLKEQLLNN